MTRSRKRQAPAPTAQLAAPPPAEQTPPPSPEVAAPPVQIAPFQKVARRYAVNTISPMYLRGIRQAADLGETQEFAELLDDVAADDEVTTLLGVMKLAVAGAPVCIEPPKGDASPAAQEVATAAHDFFCGIPDHRQLLVDLLDAEYQGFASVQPRWVPDGKRWKVDGYQAFESRFFRFPGDGETPLICTAANPNGEPLPSGVLFYRVRHRPGPVMRGGIGWAIAKPWLYKGYFLVDGASAVERFGHPHVKVQVPASAIEGSRELEMAKNAAKSLIVDQVALIPPGVTLDILETIAKSGTVKEVFLAFIAWCDAAMSKAFLGQAITTDDQGAKGSLAKAQVGFAVKAELTAHRAERLGAFVGSQLIAPFVRLHFGDKAPLPTFRLRVEPPADEKQESEVMKTRAEVASILSRQIGLPLSRAALYVGRIAPPTDDKDAIGGLAAASPPASPNGGNGGAAASARGEGVCPGCGEVISLAEAQKKKLLQDWAS